jgi:2-oxo-4-hydroxy-4-carboxy-5-ureidoimidazoline decarboxylase
MPITKPWTLDALNACSRKAFVAALGEVFEHAPWVAEAAFSQRPFATVAAVHKAMVDALGQAQAERQSTVIRAHPELGSRVAQADLTTASLAEQGSPALTG